MTNWLDKYEPGGTVAKTDATRVAAPALKLTKAQLEKNKAINKQVMAKTNKAKAEEVAKRTEARNKSGKTISEVFTNKDPYNIQERFRLFPGDTEYGQVFDEYFNPAYFTADMASNLGNALQTGDYKGAAITAGTALGAGALGFDPLGSAMKLPGKLDKVIYPTRTYRSVVPGGNKLSYESSELADKVFSKGDWTTRDLRDAVQYLSGNEMEGGRRGLLTGNDMLFTEYKVPFWKKSVAHDPDVIALKNLQGDIPDPTEFIIPNNKFLYPRRTNLIKAVPEHVKEATATNVYGEPFTLYQPGKGIFSYEDVQYTSPAYKYVEDQINAVTGQQMPYTFDYNDLRRSIPPKMHSWEQPQFAPNAGIGSFSPFENGGWLDKFDDGGEINNKSKDKQKRLVNLRDATITAEDLEYLNSPSSGYCPKGNCLENTRKGYDMTAGRLPGIPTTGNIWSNDLKAFSTSSSPTQEQIKKYPYLQGDTSSGSADSWDIQGLIVSSGGKNIYSAQPNQTVPDNVPMGAVYGWGPAGTSKTNRNYSAYNEKFGLQPSHHTTQSVGWNEKGEPILYDGHFGKYGTFNEISKLLKDQLGYELENIGVPKSIAGNTRENLEKKGILKTELTPYTADVNKLIQATNQPWAKIKEDGKLRKAKADKNQLSEFAKSLSENKGMLISNLGISNSEYDRLADVALAIAMTESEGGGALDTLDMFGNTQGMTQLDADNIMKDDRLKAARTKRYTHNASIGGNNSIRNPYNSAIATMMYLSVADKDAKRLYDEGLKPGERSFNQPGFIENFRDTNSRLNKDGIFIDELNKRIPYSQIPGYDNEDVTKVNNYLNKLTKSNKYNFVNQDGDLVLKMKTKGNNPKLSDVEKVAYMWQSPNSLKTGDAEGKSEYVNKIKNYYESLRKHENGGELNVNNYTVSAPEGYVGSGYSNVGRNYSPAWGGQFKNGGSLLDAVKAVGNYMINKPDSNAENIAEIFDPFGVSSWDDVYRSAVNPNDSWYNTLLEVAGAVPLGKLSKVTKPGIHLTKYQGLDKKLYKNLPRTKTVNNTVKGIQTVGRTSDAYQAYDQFQMGGSLPGAVGFTYARTNDPAPSEGPYAKKTMPSAENGDKVKKGNKNKNQAIVYNLPNETLERRQNVYNTIRPSNYTDISNYLRYLFNNKREEYDDARSEEAFSTYLGLKKDHKFLSPAKYRPTITNGNPQNLQYYQVDSQLEQDIFNSFKDKVKLNQILPVNENDVNSEYDPGTPGLFYENGKQYVDLTGRDGADNILGDPMASRARMMGNFNVSRGKDERGEYLSYSDQYDFPSVFQNKMQGQPYNIYGRIYYPKKENGGSMSYYQEGLDWKPKSMRKGGETPKMSKAAIARNQRIAKADAAAKQPLSPETIATRASAFPDRGSFSEAIEDSFPSVSNWIDNNPVASYIDRNLNPSVIAGKIMSNYGHIPLNIKQGDYEQAVMNAISPLTLISGAPSTKNLLDGNKKKLQGPSIANRYKQGGQLTKLDQLTNFTNYNTKQPGGWLDKYQD